MRAAVLISVCVVALSAGATPAAGGDTKAVFRSCTEEYYRRHYQQAHRDAIEPGEVLSEGELILLEARLRWVSTGWAAALDETLTLREDRTFTLEFRDIARVPEGTAYIDAVPRGPSSMRWGIWERSGSELTLTVYRIGNQVLPEVVKWRASWIGDEVVLPSWRVGFGASVLRLTASSAASPAAARPTLERRLDDLELHVREVQEALHALRTHIQQALCRPEGAVSEGSPRGVDQLMEALRSSDESAWLGAAIELARRGAVQAAPDFMRILKGTEGEQARIVAASTLGAWKVVDAVSVLIHVLADDDPLVRVAAIDSLERITGHTIQVPGEDASSARRLQQRWTAWWDENEDSVRSSVSDR